MKRELVIIKLGGSIITDKSKSRGGFRKSVVSRLIREIFEAKKKKNFDLILIHGAGAYPHYLTTKYQINKGFFGIKSAEGVSKIKLNLSKLNNLVWEECVRAGLNVWTVPASSVVITKNGKIKSFNTMVISKLLRLGITPIMHGDDTVDEVKDVAVLSGDKTLAYLAKKFRADKVIFVSDVEGVFDKNPKIYKSARRIEKITRGNLQSVIDSMEIYNRYDASGEMKGKLLAIQEELAGLDVLIVNGLTNFAVKKALLGKDIGTKIFF